MLREIQEARALGVRFEKSANDAPTAVLFFSTDRISLGTQAKVKALRTLLGLDPAATSFRLVASPLGSTTNEPSIGTRTLTQVLGALAKGVELPPSHLARRLTPPFAEPLVQDALLLHVHSGSAKPSAAYAVVPYKDEWFWIADDDWKSKRTFTSILFVFSLAETSASNNLPALTIPTR
jgi:hypothetical protein